MKKFTLSIIGVTAAGLVFSACTAGPTPATPSSASPSPASSPAAAAQTGKTFTAAQVAEHKTPTDCYISFKGQVYDVTSFVSKHPGGPGIAKACGNAVDGASSQHKGGEFDSPKVQAAIKSLVIGTLK